MSNVLLILRQHPVWATSGLLVIVSLITVGIMPSFLNEPLRRSAEEAVNAGAPDYHVDIGRLDLHPFTLSLNLRDVAVRQQANPDSPLMTVPVITANAHVLPLFLGKLAAEIALNQPIVSVTKVQLATLLNKTAQDSPEPDRANGVTTAWQDSIRSKMAFTMTLKVRQGAVSVAAPQFAEAVLVQDLNLAVDGLTNRSDDTYPTRLHIDARLLKNTRLTIDGQVDPLATPVPAVDMQLNLQDVDLPTVIKLVGQHDTPLHAGTAEAAGRLVYGPSDRSVTIDHASLQGLKVEYVMNPESSVLQSDAKQAATAAEAWQDQVAALFPVTIKEASIQGGEVLYRPDVKADPFQIHRLDLTIRNMTNRPAERGENPSEVSITASLPDQAKISLEGRANLLARPVPSVQAHVKMERVQIDSLRPLVGHFNVQLQQGTLNAQGQIQYAHQRTQIAIDDFLLEEATVDYVHREATKAKETARAKKGAQKVKEVHQDPRATITITHGKIVHSDMGFINTAASPDYRVFFSDMNLEVENFSNRLEKGTGVIKLTGNFMGSGPTVVSGNFRPEKPTPDFNVAVKIIKTKVPSMNNLLRAYSDIDTHAGWFALFSELSVKENHIEGYVKPFLKDVETYDPDKDRDKALTQKIYKAVVQGIVNLLKNTPRGEVATQTDVSGDVENPEASTWEIVGKLVQNAFFEAILPAFGRA